MLLFGYRGPLKCATDDFTSCSWANSLTSATCLASPFSSGVIALTIYRRFVLEESENAASRE